MTPIGGARSGIVGSGGSGGSGGSTIPDSEDFEHNNLTGNYGGDTSVFSIQTGTVNEGTYALNGDSGASQDAIVRDTSQSKWGPNSNRDLRITWDQYNPNQDADVQGILVGAQSVTGYSSISGYWILTGEGGNQGMEIRRVDNGSSTTLSSNGSNSPTGSWFSNTLDWKSNGTLEYSTGYGGGPLSATDTTYTDGYLGFLVYRETYIDDVQFQAI